MASYSSDFVDSDLDDIPRDVLPSPPHYSIRNMPNIAASPTRRGRGLWLSLPRRGRGLWPPSPIGPTPPNAGIISAVATSPPRREERGGYGFPHPEGEEVCNLLPPNVQCLPSWPVGARDTSQSTASLCTIRRRGWQSWMAPGPPPHAPHFPLDVCPAHHPP